MALSVTYKCDVCGVERGEANHWILARVAGGCISFTRWAQLAAPEAEKHLCGHACAQALLGRHLEETDSADKGAYGPAPKSASSSDFVWDHGVPWPMEERIL